MLNFTWLDDFRVLAATGNFSRAAQERHMTQPAFSRRVRALEEWLGAELFDRSTQPAKLTEAGEWFRGVAEELSARVARIPGEARGVAEGSNGTLRIASTHALSFTFLPRWLRELEDRTPLGPVQLVSDVMQRCEALLLQGKVQFVLGHSHAQAPGALEGTSCLSARIGEDVLLPVCAPGERGKPQFALKNKAAPPVPLLQYTQESGLGRIARAVLGPRLESVPTRAAFTAHLASVLRTMALDGRGIAWLPSTLVHEDLATGRLVVAAGEEWRVPLEIRLYREEAGVGVSGEAFWRAAAGRG
jgi:DNA-binding transcriptional LysR family regulator